MLDDILCCCCCSCKLLRSFSRVWSILGRVVIAISDSSSAMSAWRSSLGGMDMREEKSKGVLVKGHCWVTIKWQCHAERKWVGDKYMCVLLFFWAEQMCLGEKWKKQKSLSWSKNVGCSQFRVTSILGFHHRMWALSKCCCHWTTHSPIHFWIAGYSQMFPAKFAGNSYYEVTKSKGVSFILIVKMIDDKCQERKG